MTVSPDRGEAMVAALGVSSPEAEDLAVAAEAALLGGARVLEVYRTGDLAIDQAERGPVTVADRSSHAAILEYLGSARPQDAILSEEGVWEVVPEEGTRLWIVDPLDGTREFINRIGEFSVMVGLAVNGGAVLGAVYRPDSQVLYLGYVDRAAWRIECGGELETRRLDLTDRKSVGPGETGELRFVRSRSHPDERLRRLEVALSTSVVLSGSVGVKCALIAADEADLYVHPVPYLKEWDTCAPEAVLRGAGGRVTDCRGGDLAYGKPQPVQPLGIFAGSPAAWSIAAPTVFRITEDL